MYFFTMGRHAWYTATNTKTFLFHKRISLSLLRTLEKRCEWISSLSHADKWRKTNMAYWCGGTYFQRINMILNSKWRGIPYIEIFHIRRVVVPSRTGRRKQRRKKNVFWLQFACWAYSSTVFRMGVVVYLPPCGSRTKRRLNCVDILLSLSRVKVYP